MKKEILSSILLSLSFILSGCTEFMNPTKVTSTSPQTVAQAQAEPYAGPKTRVAVMSFENKTGTYYQREATYSSGKYKETSGDPIGNGMAEQLTTALVQTGAFIVLERQAIQDILKEQELGASGRIKGETAAKIGEVEGAEFLVYGAVTEFEGNQAEIGTTIVTEAAGGAAGRVGSVLGGGVGSIIGATARAVGEKVIGGAMSQDHMAIDLRIVDAKTGRIVNATSVEGKSRDLGGTFGGMFGETLLGMSGSYKTPTQKAIRACMINAVNWIAQNAFAGGVVRSPATTPTQYIPPEKKNNKETVLQVQKKLKELGYSPGPADGVMGKKTKTAIQQYQKSKGLDETGEINQATIASLGIK